MMTIRIGINGMGRMGRLGTRALFDRADLAMELVHVNEPAGGPEVTAHLLEFDSIHGRWDRELSATDRAITIDGQVLSYSQETDPSGIDWAGRGCDLVIDCTGKHRKLDLVQPYFDQGVKKVIVSAPVKDDGALNIVMGVNDDWYDPAKHQVITPASCTTNCLAPVVKVIHGTFGIKHGVITTIHDVTNTQVLVDAPHKDLRRARSGLLSLIPTSTNSATAITMIYPELKGKLNGTAVRVPLLNASITDCVFEVARPVTVDEVNAALKAATNDDLAGIMGFEDRPLVSIDFMRDQRSGIVDGPSTMVVDGTQVKLLVWYDNEMGYAHRMMELAQMVADHIG